MNLWHASPGDFAATLRAGGARRAMLYTLPGASRLTAAGDLLVGLAEAISADARDYARHEACFFEIGAESETLLAAFIHKSRRGQAAGGVRFWSYATMEHLVRDGLRLSRGMGHKCALAGLWWGGGKGVISRAPGVDYRDPGRRAAVFRDYGRFIASLRGCYITAEDVGTTPDDMAEIFTQTRFTTCIPQRLGGSGNPSILTARGVVVAMEAALCHLGAGTVAGKTVAMQGLGNVATHMIAELLERRVGRIVAADIDAEAVARVRGRFPGAPLELRLAAGDDVSILGDPCDILAPSAIGGVLNPRTIATIAAPIVCGAANNQLEDPGRDAAALHQRAILYVPDFLANRMGIVNCANEQYGSLADDPAILAHLDHTTPGGIFQRCLEIFARARASGRTPADEARMLADELAEVPHPIWGHRGWLIVDDLLRHGWGTAGP